MSEQEISDAMNAEGEALTRELVEALYPGIGENATDFMLAHCTIIAMRAWKREAAMREALKPFAAMHREESDPNEIACHRGVGFAATFITSGDFARAATVSTLPEEAGQ